MTQVSLDELLQMIGEQAVRIRFLERELAERAEPSDITTDQGDA